MEKMVLKRVKIGNFCTAVRCAADNFPDFLSEEKTKIYAALDILEGQSNAVRKNIYLRQMVDEMIPELWRSVRILKLVLVDAPEDDENAQDLKVALETYVMKRSDVGGTMFWLKCIDEQPEPLHFASAVAFEQLRDLIARMRGIDNLRMTEAVRISGIGRCNDTREEIIRLIWAAYEIAKGMTHRDSTRDAAEDVIETLDTMCATLKRNMPRRKRRGRTESEEGKETEQKGSAPIVNRESGESEAENASEVSGRVVGGGVRGG